MIVAEMHDAVRLGLDKSSNLPLPSFLPEEIDYWLNEAQIQVIKQKAFGNNFRKEGFEDSVKRVEDLATLVTISEDVPNYPHPFYPNVRYIYKGDVGNNYLSPSLAFEYMYYVDSVVRVLADSTSFQLGTRLAGHDSIRNLIETEFNKPVIRTPFVYFYEDKIGYIHDPDHSISSVHVTCIRKPKEMVYANPSPGQTIVCELPEHVHPEIVASAINMILENIESPRQETNIQQLTLKE